MPSREEFATWFRVQTWLVLVFVALVALWRLGEFAAAALGVGSWSTTWTVKLIVAAGVVVTLGLFWYAGRLRRA